MILYEGARLAFKEPFCTVSKDDSWCLKIDHPTDVVWNRTTPPHASERDAIGHKEQGNALYKEKRFGAAAAAYLAGLRNATGTDSAIERDLHRNLAQVYLSTGFWESAASHAELALGSQQDSGDIKALLRAAKAAYHLRNFAQAMDLLLRLLKLDSTQSDARTELLKVYQRLNEEQQGAYDFNAMIDSACAGNHVDAANFTRRTKVSKSPGKGNGLFATEDLAIGDLVLAEKAFVSAFSADAGPEPMRIFDVRRGLYMPTPAALWQAAVQKVVRNPSMGALPMALGGEYPGLGKDDLRIDGGRVVDAFQVHEIICRDSLMITTTKPSAKTEQWGLYTLGSGSEEEMRLGQVKPRNSGLFCHAASINPSCSPNVIKHSIGDMLIVRATRPVQKGEELLLDYGGEVYKDVRTRKQGSMASWQFACTCEICLAEEKLSDEILDRRISINAEAYKLSETLQRSLPASAHWSDAVDRLRGLLDDLRITYGTGEAPKALAYSYTTITTLAALRRDPKSHGRATILGFETLEWLPPFETQGVLTAKPGSSTTLDMNIKFLLCMTHAAAARTGADAVAEGIRKQEASVYLALNGTMNGYKTGCYVPKPKG